MDAAGKLRMVLDYVPCEACLAQPTDDPHDQDLLCSICARVHRDVAVRVSMRTTILVERPELSAAAVVIPPAVPQPAPEPEAAPEELPVVLEAFEPPPPLVALDAEFEPPEPARKRRGFFRRREEEPAPALVADAEPEFDDVAEYTPPVEDLFGVAYGPSERLNEPPVERPVEVEAPRDDFVFMPPEPARPAPPPVEEVGVAPSEEVAVEQDVPEESPWAPPEEIFPEEPSQPQALAQESVTEVAPEEHSPYAAEPDVEVCPAEIVEEDEPAPQNPVVAPVEEEEILETTIVEPEEEVLETTLVDEEPPAAAPPAPSDRSDLWRLRGFHADAEKAFAQQRIQSLSHLSGHDAGELADRTELPEPTVRAWVNVADLVQEAGIPVDAAVALVAAGVEGPRGLRESDVDDILDRVGAFGGGYSIQAADLKRWKRRV